MRIMVTGGAGFIGSHAAEFYASKGEQVIVYDNLSRAKLLNKLDNNATYNWNFLKKFKNVTLVKGDVRDFDELLKSSQDMDVIIHAAAQTAVTTSLTDPRTDFETNASGTFNVLEAARKNGIKQVLYCSTNKVYGENVNNVGVTKGKTRYSFESKFRKGIPEQFATDLNEHTPYGCSKLTGDLYVQEYAHLYGLKTGVFRMSCIYGTRQFGVEDQGWVAWFVIAALTGKPLTIYGDGLQVRDILYVKDLIRVYDSFVNSKLKHGVFNIGGGENNTISLVELLEMIKKATGKAPKLKYDGWRPSDQKVYISDISHANKILGWQPQVSPDAGVKLLIDWVSENKTLF
jgi:CDP-paratose 2-epimerase